MKAESTFSSQTPGFEVLDYFKRFQKIVPTFDTPSPWIASRARLTTGVLQTSLPRLAKMRDDIRSIRLRRPPDNHVSTQSRILPFLTSELVAGNQSLGVSRERRNDAARMIEPSNVDHPATIATVSKVWKPIG